MSTNNSVLLPNTGDQNARMDRLLLRKIVEGYQNYIVFCAFKKIYTNEKWMYLIVLVIWNYCEYQIKFTLHWLQYSTSPNVLTLYIKSSQTIETEFKPAFLACKPKRQVA